MLSLFLARCGIPVTLLEMHKDFDREFRGDTIHPSTLEILDQIGLADKLHEIPHTKISGPTIKLRTATSAPSISPPSRRDSLHPARAPSALP